MCVYILFSFPQEESSSVYDTHSSVTGTSKLKAAESSPLHRGKAQPRDRAGRERVFRDMLTAGSAVPSAGWSWISAGPGGRGERWAAATSWFCSHDPRRRSCRGCQCAPPSLKGRKDTERDEEEKEELGQEGGSLSSAQVFPPSHAIICG